MCMIPLCLIERERGIGWKVMDKDKATSELTTPYRMMKMEIGKTYFAEGIEERGIYIFLNKSIAKKFLEHLWILQQKDTLLAKIELGNNIWKGAANSFPEWASQNYHFYTTDFIRILSLEE